MRRPGYNSVRRNRNIGTAKQGHGQDNRLVIPQPRTGPPVFWEPFTDFAVVTRTVHGRAIPFVVEPTRQGSVYACTVDDVAAILERAPVRHVGGLHGVILRQPSRKEEVLSGAWGRFGYWVDVGPIHGPAIIVQACPVPLMQRWPRRLCLTEQQELDRLRLEADRADFDGHRHVLHFGLEAVRAVQLYRTVLHELGHWADCFEKVEAPARGEPADTEHRLWDVYWRRPTQEREAFAHRYAAELGQRLRACGAVPFPRILNVQKLEAEGLSAEDFVLREG